jgi:hypothetical protein
MPENEDLHKASERDVIAIKGCLPDHERLELVRYLQEHDINLPPRGIGSQNREIPIPARLYKIYIELNEDLGSEQDPLDPESLEAMALSGQSSDSSLEEPLPRTGNYSEASRQVA